MIYYPIFHTLVIIRHTLYTVHKGDLVLSRKTADKTYMNSENETFEKTGMNEKYIFFRILVIEAVKSCSNLTSQDQRKFGALHHKYILENSDVPFF